MKSTDLEQYMIKSEKLINDFQYESYVCIILTRLIAPGLSRSFALILMMNFGDFPFAEAYSITPSVTDLRKPQVSIKSALSFSYPLNQ